MESKFIDFSSPLASFSIDAQHKLLSWKPIPVALLNCKILAISQFPSLLVEQSKKSPNKKSFVVWLIARNNWSTEIQLYLMVRMKDTCLHLLDLSATIHCLFRALNFVLIKFILTLFYPPQVFVSRFYFNQPTQQLFGASPRFNPQHDTDTSNSGGKTGKLCSSQWKFISFPFFPSHTQTHAGERTEKASNLFRFTFYWKGSAAIIKNTRKEEFQFAFGKVFLFSAFAFLSLPPPAGW